MRSTSVWSGLAILACLTALPLAQTPTARTLDVYLIDVEGGNATLFVSPSGESLLIDTGNGGGAATRDAERIVAATKDAGIQRIDHLITTHWHGDHFGGMAEAAARIPIGAFVDHGPSVERNANADAFLHETYPRLYGKAKRTIVQPGDTIAMTGLDVRVVTSAGERLATPLPGAGRPNPYCATFRPQAVDTTENAQSVGTHVTFGKFRALHLGDLTANKEFDLVCPNNRLGTVDLFVVTHHGQAVSNAAVLVHAVEPRVAIMNNGTRKGGQPDAMKTIYSAPGLEDLWQLHFSLLSGQEYTVPGIFIANVADDQPAAMPISALPPPPPGPGTPPPPAHNGPAHWIKVSARPDGSFTVTNSRNGFNKAYSARR